MGVTPFPTCVVSGAPALGLGGPGWATDYTAHGCHLRPFQISFSLFSPVIGRLPGVGARFLSVAGRRLRGPWKMVVGRHWVLCLQLSHAAHHLQVPAGKQPH